MLDFVNTYEEITEAFAPYYTTTLLSNSVTPTAIYDMEAKIDAYTVIDPDDVENFIHKKAEEHTENKLVAQPVTKLPTAENFGLTEAKAF